MASWLNTGEYSSPSCDVRTYELTWSYTKPDMQYRLNACINGCLAHYCTALYLDARWKCSSLRGTTIATFVSEVVLQYPVSILLYY